MAEDRLAAPVPTEEHRRLQAFAGEWNGEETVLSLTLGRRRTRDRAGHQRASI